ncbi:polysaccharide pyruvyl transferase family protein [Planctomycetes bacterium TBK1r]|uniref:Exopolysaccharide glucosyl ketal-pyruvate-transferase n=1 Tax=Stieleria magnilauensis TaxID=2527963 RepID=A0ABX5XRK8_9BACT|nr:Exopolysaccharide glucosyl ketal-pyruvate-transferase [Planctomycetes bacterium TBK1r]
MNYRLEYYRAPSGNFGDDLNLHLFTRLLGPSDPTSKNSLIAIGSLLHRQTLDNLAIPDDNRIHVFGTGARGPEAACLGDNVRFHFTRGPLTASVYSKPFIADPAYLVKLVASQDAGADAVGFMPHIHSEKLVNWAMICSTVGCQYISPTNDVETTLAAICRCKLIVTEAMHGAIVADALGIPWVRFRFASHFRESISTSEFKWSDWLLSVKAVPVVFEINFADVLARLDGKLLALPVRRLFERKLIRKLRSASISQGSLSNTETRRDTLVALEASLRNLERELA